MDGPKISVDAGAKRHRTFMIAALCICIAAASFGLIDLIRGYHRVAPTCLTAGFAFYFASKLKPNRWFQIVAVILSMAAIGVFYVGTK